MVGEGLMDSPQALELIELSAREREENLWGLRFAVKFDFTSYYVGSGRRMRDGLRDFLAESQVDWRYDGDQYLYFGSRDDATQVYLRFA